MSDYSLLEDEIRRVRREISGMKVGVGFVAIKRAGLEQGLLVLEGERDRMLMEAGGREAIVRWNEVGIGEGLAGFLEELEEIRRKLREGSVVAEVAEWGEGSSC